MSTVDYMNIQQRPDINPIDRSVTGSKLTKEEIQFIYYLVAGYGLVESYVKAGLVSPRPEVHKDKREGLITSSRDEVLLRAEPSTSKENLPGGEENKEKEDCLVINRIDKQLPYIEITPDTDIASLPIDVKKSLYKSAYELTRRPNCQREYSSRVELLESARVADAQEIYTYLTAVMRGQVKDQFGLDASLQERTRAAESLAKRLIDMPAKFAAQEKLLESGNVNINIIQRDTPKIEIKEAEYTEM